MHAQPHYHCALSILVSALKPMRSKVPAPGTVMRSPLLQETQRQGSMCVQKSECAQPCIPDGPECT